MKRIGIDAIKKVMQLQSRYTLDYTDKQIAEAINDTVQLIKQSGYMTETAVDEKLLTKAEVTHGTHVTYSTNAPEANGTAAPGSASTVSRSDHVHPAELTASYKAILDSMALSSVGGNATGLMGIMYTAIGGGSTAGQQSVSVGYGAKAPSSNATAIGANTSACSYGTAVGQGAIASGDAAMAIGSSANANGKNPIAIGGNSLATGGYSIALGWFTNVSGAYSVGLGYNASVPSTSQYTIQLGDDNLSSLKSKVSLTVTSDIRDKTDITEVDSRSLEFLSRIHPIRYVFNQRSSYIDQDNLTEEDKEKLRKYGICKYNQEEYEQGTKKGNRIRIGVSAQEVQKALIDVFGDSSYINLVDDNLFDLDPDSIPEDIESQLSVNYSGFIPLLIKAIHELIERDEKQQEEIDRLKEIISTTLER